MRKLKGQGAVALILNKNIPLLIVTGFVVLSSALLSPKIAPDSLSFINYYEYRSPGYPIIINGLLYFSNIANFLPVLFQGILGIYCSQHLVNTLKTKFVISSTFATGLLFILMLPIFGMLHRYYLSEAIAYPLFLLFISLYITYLADNKNLNKILLISFTLILVRGNFVYLIPLLFLTAIINKTNKDLINIAILSIFIVFSPLVYHKIKHDKFMTTPLTSAHIVVPLLYIADINKNYDFKSADAKNAFILAKEKMQQQNLAQTKRSIFSIPYEYYTNYDKILYGSLYKAFNQLDINSTVTHDQIMKSIAKSIIKQDYLQYFILVIKIILYQLQFLLIPIIILAGSIYLTKKITFAYKLAISMVLLAIGHFTLIALFQAPLMRYNFYLYPVFIIFSLVGVLCVDLQRQSD